MKVQKMITYSAMISVIVLFVFSGIGFADKKVDLEYEPAGIDPAPCSKSVAIVTFEDKRDVEAIGESGKGEKFYSKTPVNEWISRALYDELRRAGCNAQYHSKMGDYGADFTVAGEVQQAYIKQDSAVKYNVDIVLKVDIYSGGKKIAGKTYNSSMAKNTSPSFSFKTSVATQMLQDVMREAVPDLQDRLK
jgi:hypothetical protein